jgi:DNA-binding MarR family transcriptional regulator
MSRRTASGEELHDLFHAVFELHGTLTAVMDDVHARVGLRTSQCMVTDALERQGTASVPEIAAALGVSRQHVQVTCDELERMGVVEFRDSPRHKRSKLVTLTDHGRRLVARAGKAEAAIIEKALPGVDRGKTTGAAALLRAIAQRIASAGKP